ncbi:YlxM family DNA-binding protein [Halanaerobium hydrogeniformans]|uniref:UPF0122 protein Halsa_1370 n=1 Tax=Halanaerobium hydrogeniformans TaxID=656519 RepID=E4RL33_HALHG|nr:YlxM family DNA-binding protein [Halanaerobium hydrogeniformans]ADQ14797.1 helix-turn-helix protein YlxM/p13 family protein [Halanaerobium hydrogeniformans]
MLKKTIKMTLLFDFYGSLLTEKQQQINKSYFYNDLSLAEIADNIGISRQGVYDHLKRSEKSLKEYEAKLGLVKKYRELRKNIKELESLLLKRDLLASDGNDEVSKKLESIKSIL